MENAGVTVADDDEARANHLGPGTEPATFLIDEIGAEFGLRPFLALLHLFKEDKRPAQRTVLHINPDDLALALAADIGILGNENFLDGVGGNRTLEAHLALDRPAIGDIDLLILFLLGRFRGHRHGNRNNAGE